MRTIKYTDTPFGCAGPDFEISEALGNTVMRQHNTLTTDFVLNTFFKWLLPGSVRRLADNREGQKLILISSTMTISLWVCRDVAELSLFPVLPYCNGV